jgi:hypothetical protein
MQVLLGDDMINRAGRRGCLRCSQELALSPVVLFMDIPLFRLTHNR